MNSIRRIVAAAVCCSQITACASSPGSIDAKYVSPNIYKDWTCSQLGEEHERLSREVTRVSGLQRENANADAAMMTVGVILLWPVLFGLAATKDRKDELGRLKGEYEAVDQQGKVKQCPAPVPVMPAPVAPSSPTPNVNAAPPTSVQTPPPAPAVAPVQPASMPAPSGKPGYTECREEEGRLICK